MKTIKGMLILLFLLSLISTASAQEYTHVISNSEKWQDVYSAIQYARLTGAESDFLVSTKHGSLILNNIRKDNKIRVITSREFPYVFNYPSQIISRGFAGADEIVVDDANTELIKEIANIKNFVVVDDSYGYSAMAVSPYASMTRSWVFLANSANAYEIEDVLNGREVENVLIYGYVNREVRDILEKYSPKVIDNQDKFKDNIEIVELFLKEKSTKQTVLTNGEFIEKEIMSGKEPVLFTGRENVPEQIREYLKTSPLEIGVLIGNELVGAATNIRRTTGLSVMVKFARGARTQTGGVAAVEGLDLFPLPTPSVSLELYSIKYNRVNSQLEVTYKSSSNVPAYFKGTITLIGDGDRSKVGDSDPIFIAPEDFKTISYPVNISSTGGLTAEVYTLFGEAPSALDRILEGSMEVSIIDVIDGCEIEIKEVSYNKQKKVFAVKTKNIGNVNCWVDIELKDVIIDNRKRTLGTEGSTEIHPGKTRSIVIEQELSDEDIEKNPFVDLIAYYGEREDSLVNIFKGRFELKIKKLTLITYVVAGLVVIIAVLIILIIIMKRKEKEENY